MSYLNRAQESDNSKVYEKRWREAGYPPEVFKLDCAKFIFDDYYNEPMAYYGHKIVILDGEAALPFSGGVLKWSELEKSVFPKTRYPYLENGFALSAPPIKPIRHDTPNGKYAFTVFTTVIGDENSLQPAMHSYFEVTKPNGEVYNFGLVGNRESAKGGVSYGYSTVNAPLKCPDLCAFMVDKTIYKTPFDLKIEDGEKIWEQLEQESTNGVPYSFLENNCAHFVASHAKVVGIDIPVNRSLLGIILPERFNLAAERVWSKVPSLFRNIFTALSKIVLLVPTIFLNSIGYCFLGGWRKADWQQRKVAIIANPYDFFFKFPTLNRPWAVLEWQKEQKQTIKQAPKKV